MIGPGGGHLVDHGKSAANRRAEWCSWASRLSATRAASKTTVPTTTASIKPVRSCFQEAASTAALRGACRVTRPVPLSVLRHPELPKGSSVFLVWR